MNVIESTHHFSRPQGVNGGFSTKNTNKPGPGHNSGWDSYGGLRWAVWDSREPTAAKILALAILEHMEPGKLEASPSRTRLAQMCGISERTLQRHWGTISRWIDLAQDNGRCNIYKARVYACSAELLRLIDRGTPDTVSEGQPGPSVKLAGSPAAPSDKLAEGARVTPCQNVRGIAPAAQPSGRRWAARDPFNLNPYAAKEAKDVWFDEEFRLHVCNGFQAEMTSILAPAGLNLREALDEAARWVPPAAAPFELKIKVRGQITKLAREAKERAAARKTRAVPQNPAMVENMKRLQAEWKAKENG